MNWDTGLCQTTRTKFIVSTDGACKHHHIGVVASGTLVHEGCHDLLNFAQSCTHIHMIMLSQFSEEGVDGAKIARLPMNPHDLGGTY